MRRTNLAALGGEVGVGDGGSEGGSQPASTEYLPQISQAQPSNECPLRPAYEEATVYDYPPRKPARKGEEGTSKTDCSQLLIGPLSCRLRSSHLALTALARVNWNPRG